MMLPLVCVLSLALQAPAVQGPVGDRLDSIVQAAEARGFHGSVLVAQGGQTILEKGYGFANHATGLRFSPTTLVQIGSNVKDMTKVALYQLIERGRLQLTDSLPKFFPGVPADKRGITVQQLMTHRAGLPLALGGGDDRGPTKAELLREVFALPLASPPGTAERYSNTGYAMLAAIIEQVSGQPFDQYVIDNILGPAGMSETGSHLRHFDPARLAHGYSSDNADRGVVLDKPHDATGHLYQLRGNGGYVSTPSDMMKFYHALENATLLRDPAHRREILNPGEPGVFAGSDLVSFFLFGNFPGAGAEVIIASNHADYRGNRLLQEMLPALGVRMGGGDGGGRQMVTTGPGAASPSMPALPDDGPGRTVAAYVAAFNTGDTAVMRRFFAERTVPNPAAPPMEQRLQRYQDMFSNLGRLTVRGVRLTPEGDGLEVTMDGTSGDTATVTFVLEQVAPYRVKGVRVMVG